MIMNRSSSLRNCLVASSAALMLFSANSFGENVWAEANGNWNSDIWAVGGTVPGGPIVPGARPGADDIARMHGARSVTVNSNVGTVSGITLQGTNGVASNDASLTLNSGAIVNVTTSIGFNNNSGTRTLTLNEGSQLTIGTLLNQANGANTSLTTVNAGASLTMAGLRAAQTGTGTLDIVGGSVLVTGVGQVSALVGSTGNGTLRVRSGGQYVSNTTLTMANNSGGTGTLDLQGGTVVIRGALLKGNGTAAMTWAGGSLSVQTTDLATINNNGTGVFAPGEIGAVGSFSLAAGASTIYTQGATASMNLDFATNASFDTVAIGAGTSLVVNLNGTIVLNLIGAYVPTEGLTFDVITATDIVDNGFVLGGNGASYFTHQIITSGGTDILRLTAVPEPSTYALLAAVGVIGMALRRRRR